MRSMVGLYRLYWIPFTFRMPLITYRKKRSYAPCAMISYLTYTQLYNIHRSTSCPPLAVHQPSVRPGVRRPSKMRKAQRPSRCRAWKTEVDGHKLRLHQGSFAKPMKQHDQPLISLGLAKKSNSKSASKP